MNILNRIKEWRQIRLVKRNGVNIRLLKNPSEAVQLASIESYSGTIHFIKSPSEAVQLVAVKSDYAFGYIDKPTMKTKLRFINYHWRLKWRIKLQKQSK